MINFPDSPSTGASHSSGGKSWVYDGTKWLPSAAAPKYVVGCFVPGTLSANQLLLHHRATRAVTIPADWASYAGHASQAGGSAAATSSVVITVAKALAVSPTTFTAFGTITITAGSITPVFATSGSVAVNFAAGDVLRLTAPATPDPSFAGFYASLVAYEG